MNLSIITIHLNDFANLKRTFDSVCVALKKMRFQWVVIDGNSEINGVHRTLIDEVKSVADCFVSATDNGIYDAMNKGARLACGNYVLFLNAGDELHPDFELEQFLDVTAKAAPDMIWGRCEVCYADGSRILVKTRSTSWAWYCMPAYHPAILFRRSVLGEHPYDVSYSYAADYDLVCRLLKNGATVKYLLSPISTYYRGGISDVDGDAAREEENMIRLKYFQIPAFLGDGVKAFKRFNIRQSLFSKFTRQLRKKI